MTSETGTPRRLWSRTALRFLSILVLLFGLLGGAFLQAHPQTPAAIPYGNVKVQGDNSAAQLAAQVPAGAAYAAAQNAAQAKAAAAAAAAAAKAKAALEKARRERAAVASSRDDNRNNGNTTYNGPVPASCQDYSGNRALGCTLLLAAGFALSEMPCLDKMWTHESNWRTTAKNPSSGSYGIPQALPGDRMKVFGADYLTNPATQIKWGLDYITKRYNSPCGAWGFWQNHNWY